MNSYPTDLKLTDNAALEITWSDGNRLLYPFRMLRDSCPCATCREKRTKPPEIGQLPILNPEQIQPLQINSMKPVGQYAYTIEWSDGHDTGIYPFELLLAIGEAT